MGGAGDGFGILMLLEIMPGPPVDIAEAVHLPGDRGAMHRPPLLLPEIGAIRHRPGGHPIAVLQRRSRARGPQQRLRVGIKLAGPPRCFAIGEAGAAVRQKPRSPPAPLVRIDRHRPPGRRIRRMPERRQQQMRPVAHPSIRSMTTQRHSFVAPVGQALGHDALHPVAGNGASMSRSLRIRLGRRQHCKMRRAGIVGHPQQVEHNFARSAALRKML